MASPARCRVGLRPAAHSPASPCPAGASTLSKRPGPGLARSRRGPTGCRARQLSRRGGDVARTARRAGGACRQCGVIHGGGHPHP
ncbi:MAG: hypothetical protein MZU91_01345 [Desulfosudis oleivorans]|nr:hypothetical protein [Desulfosudis oleivorans]